MKTLWFCLAYLTLTATCIGQDAPGKALDIAVLDNGSAFIATMDGVLETQLAWIRKGTTSDTKKVNTVHAHVVRAWKNVLFAASRNEYWQRDPKGEYKKLLDQDAITKLVGSPATIQTIAVDSYGNQFIAIENEAQQSALVRRNATGKVTVDLNFNQLPEFNRITSLVSAGETSLLAHSAKGETTYILCLLQKKMIGTVPMGPVKSLVYDNVGRLYGINTTDRSIVILDHPKGQMERFRKKYQHPPKGTAYSLEESQTFQVFPADSLTFHSATNQLTGLTAQEGNNFACIPYSVGGIVNPVNEAPLPFTVAPAFPSIEWTGWEPVNEKGVPVPLRPLILTHANDQSGRNFVATQHGVIHVFRNKPDVKKTEVFLDIQDRVTYKDSQNEEGFLGLAFHPRYKQNGEFFVYYTKKPGLLSVISRFKVSKDNPNRADKASEEVLLTIKQPMWNHNGGTLVFGPDGYLYIGMGDGGGANDMFKNSRKMNTFHSKILRIDVDTRSGDKPYGIPQDNPFVGQSDAFPEIFAFGVRNVWRMSFDRETGQGWFADVGQNLYEEINLLQKGADYGWNTRESFHPFGAASQVANDKMLEPIWEYHHNVGKSITGGFVYRGKAHPELRGMYLYADYVSNKIWALQYDFEKKRVIANREIANRNQPIMSFGEDEDGELYLLTFSASGQGIDRLVRK
ncbi:MAG: PQQ-dependent sugar dehydrogenase [Gemmatales bacterium]